MLAIAMGLAMVPATAWANVGIPMIVVVMPVMVPFFFASWWTEYWLARRLFKDLPRPAVWTAARNANLISYGLLTLWPLAHFVAV